MIGNNSYKFVKESILDYISSKGCFTIPAISEITGISTTTISKHVSKMIEDQLIMELSVDDSQHRGRHATVYGIKPDSYYFVGADMKNIGLEIGLMDFTGKIVRSYRNDRFRFENSHSNLELLCDDISAFIASLDGPIRGGIAGIGLNLGGRVNSKLGTSASMYNFEETQDTPLATLLTERFGIPTVIANDTKAMAYAEYLSYGKEWENVLYVNIGWGLGLGIIIGGDIYYGGKGYSGEMGHIHTYDNNILCHCGKKGCMETEISCQAIIRKLTERVRGGESSLLSAKIRRGEEITTNDIILATEKEDPLCIDLVTETGRELGRQLAGMINLFNPDCIIIGGKLAKVSPFYFQQQVALAVRQYSLKLMSSGVPILTSRLGDDAGILGACLAVRREMFSK